MNRRWGTGLNVVVAGVLALIVFGMVNLLASRYYKRFDLTAAKIYSLSEKSRSVLANLTDPLTVTIFYQPDHPLYDPVTGLLTEYEGASGLVTVEKVDPHRDIAKAQALAQKYSIDALNVVVFESGEKSKYVTDEAIADFEFSGYMQGAAPKMTAFKGEEAFTAAILSVTQERLPIVRFTTGHGERPMENPDLTGISQAIKLIKQDNMDVGSIALLGEEDLSPDEIDCLVIAGPTRRFSESEIELVTSFLDEGGAVLALLDPLLDSGVERIANVWGIEVGSDVVVDPAQKLPFVSAANVFISNYSPHAITRGLEGVATLFPLVRSVSPAAETPEGIEVRTLATTTQEGWGEIQVEETRFSFDAEADRAGPVSIAAAATKEASRFVVVGDSDFMTNSQVSNVGNGDFFLNCVNWLTQRELLISISPKIPDQTRLNLTNRQMAHVFWQTVIGLPVLSLVLGGAVWWRRRQ